ncbi:MAG: hypothetical protein ACO3EE_10350 [Flavobacteriales bacterium]
MKKLFFTLTILFATNILFSQKSKTLEIYEWGIGWASDSSLTKIDEDCAYKLQQKYGFTYRYISGCNYTSNQVNKWKKHNKKVEDEIAKTHGANWRDKYIEKLKACSK